MTLDEHVKRLIDGNMHSNGIRNLIKEGCLDTVERMCRNAISAAMHEPSDIMCKKTAGHPHDYAHYPVEADGRRVYQMHPDKQYAARMFCRHCGKPK